MAWVLGANRATLAAASLSSVLRAHLGLEEAGPHDDVRLADMARRHGTLDPRDQAALDELVRGEDTTPARLAALGRHLAALGARRPLVVIVDGGEGTTGDRTGLAALVDETLARRHTAPTPILFVWVAEGRSDDERWRDWVGRPGVDRVSVGPLPNRVIRAIVRSWIWLDETDVVKIARRAAGHVAVARRLLVEFVHRGVHRPLPVDPGDEARLAQALTEEGDSRALELAATMGQVVAVGPWRRQAAEIDAVRDDNWLRDLARSGLLVRLVRPGADAPEQFRFATPGIRQALLARAREGGRLRSLYQLTVAGALVDPPQGRWTWGEQLAEAGLDELAAPAWLTASVALSDRGDPAGAAVLAAWAEALAARTDDPEIVARSALLRSRCAIERGLLAEVRPTPEGAPWDPREVVAFVRGWPGIPEARPTSPEGTFYRGRALYRSGELAQAIETWTALSDRPEPHAGLGLAWAARAWMWQGDVDSATAVLEQVGSRDRLPVVRQEVRAVRAELARAAGRLDEAVERFGEVMTQRRDSGGVDAVRVQLQLAVLHTMTGRHVEADPLLRRAAIEAVRREDPSHQRFAHAVSAMAALALEDAARLDVEIDAITGAPFDADPEVHATLAWLGEALAQRGHAEDSAALGAELAVWRVRAGRAVTALRWWDSGGS